MVENEEQCVSDFIFILFWRATANVSEIDGLATAALKGLADFREVGAAGGAPLGAVLVQMMLSRDVVVDQAPGSMVHGTTM